MKQKRQNFIMVGIALVTLSLWGLYACGDDHGGGTEGDGSGIIGDDDNDGVADGDDLCPETPAGEVVAPIGCSLDQLIPCDGPASGGSWASHDDYVAAFTAAADAFLGAGLIDSTARDAAVAAATLSSCGEPAATPVPTSTPEPTATPEATATPEPTATPGPTDSDSDGVMDDVDECPDTPAGEVVNDVGCSVSQLAPCDGEWKNHGAYVIAVAKAAKAFYDAGLLTKQQVVTRIVAAANSDCGRSADHDTCEVDDDESDFDGHEWCACHDDDDNGYW